jgi:hypothetical protein
MSKYLIILFVIISILACGDYEPEGRPVQLDDCPNCELTAPDTDESINVIE